MAKSEIFAAVKAIFGKINLQLNSFKISIFDIIILLNTLCKQILEEGFKLTPERLAQSSKYLLNTIITVMRQCQKEHKLEGT